ncbi:MAG: PilZ domain-containing protein [Burkholderiales bacterium]|jgi:hypothetical protein|nr:PilZ domain-containing protein [Burkholderiales bacterium]
MDDEGTRPEGNPATAELSATAPVSLRWRLAGSEDPELVDAECAASLRALEACLEGDASKPAAIAQGRLEAKIDLLLLTLDRLAGTLAGPPGRQGRSSFLGCHARFGAASVEWLDPGPPPPDGTRVVLEIRAAPGHPVSACLPATLMRVGTAPDTDGAAGTHMVARLAPMSMQMREAYERCVFILHRQAIRRAAARPLAG